MNEGILSSGAQDRHYIIKGFLINSLGIVANSISPLLVLGLARYFSQEEFGLFISVQVFVLTISKLFVLGFDKGLMWFIPHGQWKSEDHGNALYSVLNVTLLFAASGCLILSFALTSGLFNHFEMFNHLPVNVMTICIWNILPLVILQIGEGTFEGLRKPQIKIVVKCFLANAMFPIFAVLCHLAGAGIYSLSLGYTIANALGALTYLWLFQRYFFFWRPGFAVPTSLKNYSLPLVVADIIGSMLLRMDIWMIFLLVGPAAAAIYSVMVLLSNGIKMVRQNFDPLLVTVVSGMNAARIQNELKDTFSFSIDTITTIQFVIALFVLFIPKEVLSIAGKDYTTVPMALAVLVIGNMINGLLGGNGLILRGMGKSKLIMYINVMALIVNLGGNWLLIPQLGLVGAAMASAIALLFQNLCFLISVRFITGKHYYKRSLLINFMLVAGFSFAIFLEFQRIQAHSTAMRLSWLVTSLFIFGGALLVRWRRRVF